MKILIIGPAPPPINGCSYANQVIATRLMKMGVEVELINTSSTTLSSKQGRFSVSKFADFVRNYINFTKVFGAQVVYMTPGQTFLGLVKYAPFMILCKLCGVPYVVHLLS